MVQNEVAETNRRASEALYRLLTEGQRLREEGLIAASGDLLGLASQPDVQQLSSALANAAAEPLFGAYGPSPPCVAAY